jgi:elongation factor Ts
MVEINCETDLSARDRTFAVSRRTSRGAAAGRERADLDAPLAAKLATRPSTSGARAGGEDRQNISVRRCVVMTGTAALGAYLHGTRIGTLVAIEGGGPELAHDLAMHVAASNPRYLSAAEVPAEIVVKERVILTEQAQGDPKNQGKPEQVLGEDHRGKLAKALSEITPGPAVHPRRQAVGREAAESSGPRGGLRALRSGAGIEKKQGDFVAEVRRR